MVDEAAAAVEFVGRIAVVDFEVQELRAVLARGFFGKVEKLRANSLPSMGGFDEEFVDPRTFAAVFEAEVEADDEVGDGILVFADDVGETEVGIVEKFVKIFANGGFVKRFGPGIVVLHVAHQLEDSV